MKYQIWDMVSYGHGEPLEPFMLYKESELFEDIYHSFNKRIKEVPCIITLENPLIKDTPKSNKKIYESPDGGKTLYVRDFGDYNNRVKIK